MRYKKKNMLWKAKEKLYNSINKQNKLIILLHIL